jgi:hypothetical protein
MLSLKIEKQKFKRKRLKTFWPKIAKLSGPKLRILKRKTGRTWEYGPVQHVHRSEKAAKAWAVFSFTHVSRIWPNALWVVHLGLTARRYSREIKIAPEGTLLHPLRESREEGVTRSTTTGRSGDGVVMCPLANERCSPRVSAPPSSRPAVAP